MAVDVVMPQMGESIFEGTITKWLKKPGDKVERDEPLFEISTDKVDAEIPSPSAGVLKEIKIPEGQTVPIQTIVAVIDGAGSAAAAAPAPAPAPAKAATASAPAPAPAPAAAKPSPPAPVPAPVPAAPAVAASGERIHSSPLVRRLAKEHGIDLSGVEGSGAGGRITKEDIESLIAAQSAPAVAGPCCRRAASLGPDSLLPAHPPCMARSLFPRCRSACPASASISAITKCSRSASCARRSPSTWSSPSTFRRMSTPSTKLI